MKLPTTLLTLTLLPLTLSAPLEPRQQTGTSTVSYDPKFDVGSSSLTTVACSDGANGLMPPYTTFGSLPSFPRIGGAPTVSGWNSDKCGACYRLDYTSRTGTNSIYVTAVDAAPGGFNIGLQAMNQLTGGRAVEFGRVNVAWTEVEGRLCGF